MSERIVIDVDRDGWTKGLQLNIAQLDESGNGSGYRLAGPKYNGSSENLLRRVLDGRDAAEIRKLLDAVFPPTVYRAWHYETGITLGHYLTRDEARKHCVAKAEQEEPFVDSADWVPCHDTDDEDGSEELVIVSVGEVFETGYTVTPIVPAARYDEEADE